MSSKSSLRKHDYQCLPAAVTKAIIIFDFSSDVISERGMKKRPSFFTAARHLHELITDPEAFFKQTVRPAVIAEQTDQTVIFRHDNKDITGFRLAVQPLMDYI